MGGMSWLVWVHKKGGRREEEKNRRPSVPFGYNPLFFFFTGEGSPPTVSGDRRTGPSEWFSLEAVMKASFLFIAGSWLNLDLIRLFAFGLWCILSQLGRRGLPTGLLGVWAEKKISEALKIQSGGQCLTSQRYPAIRQPWMANRAMRPFRVIH
jgi:hypothetical protein